MGAPLNGVLYDGAPLNGVLYNGAPLNGVLYNGAPLNLLCASHPPGDRPGRCARRPPVRLALLASTVLHAARAEAEPRTAAQVRMESGEKT